MPLKPTQLKYSIFLNSSAIQPEEFVPKSFEDNLNQSESFVKRESYLVIKKSQCNSQPIKKLLCGERKLLSDYKNRSTTPT